MLFLLTALAVAAAPDTTKTALTADVGFVNTAGNTSLTTFNFGNKFEATSSAWGFVQTFSSVIGSSEGETTTSLWRAAVRGDRNFSERVSLYVLSEFDRNRFAGISSRYGESAGLAVKLGDSERTRLSAEAGAGYIWQNATEPGQSSSFAAGRLAGILRQKLGERAEFSQVLELLPNFKASDDLRINSETSLSAPIAAGISMKAGYTIRHDGLPEAGFEKTDRIFTTGVQVSF